MLSHKDLDVWKKSIDFAVQIYTFTEAFPPEEKYALASQLKRAGVSIASNISEGAARNSRKEYVRFLYVALGSASEIETQLIIAQKLGFGQHHQEMMHELINIQKMLMGVIKYLKTQQN